MYLITVKPGANSPFKSFIGGRQCPVSRQAGRQFQNDTMTESKNMRWNGVTIKGHLIYLHEVVPELNFERGI